MHVEHWDSAIPGAYQLTSWCILVGNGWSNGYDDEEEAHRDLRCNTHDLISNEHGVLEVRR